MNPLTPTIFHEAWWLDLVSSGRYEEVRVVRSGRLVGRLPFVTSRRFGMHCVTMPMLTHYLGPAIDAGTGTEPTRALNHLTISKELVDQLPRAAHVYISHHRGVSETIAFEGAGFRSDVQYTYEIEPASRRELWLGMRDKTRNVIRRAQERYVVDEVREPSDFTAFYEANLRDRGHTNRYDMSICRALMAECRSRGVGRILAVRDRDGRMKAAIFTMWDAGAEYYFLSSRRCDAGNGAVSLLVWEAIIHAATLGVRFDFDIFTNMNEAIFFSGFGGVIRPHIVSYYNSSRYRTLNRLSQIRWRGSRARP